MSAGGICAREEERSRGVLIIVLQENTGVGRGRIL